MKKQNVCFYATDYIIRSSTVRVCSGERKRTIERMKMKLTSPKHSRNKLQFEKSNLSLTIFRNLIFYHSG